MKLNRLLQVCTVLILVLPAVPGIQAQSRYKHLPRVRVDRKHVTTKKTDPEQKEIAITPLIKEGDISQEKFELENNENLCFSTQVLSTGKKPVPLQNKKVVLINKSTNFKKTATYIPFTKKVKKNFKLSKSVNWEDEEEDVPGILMIAFYGAGGILLILALLTFLGLIGGGSFGLFLGLLIGGSVLLVAACVLMVLIITETI